MPISLSPRTTSPESISSRPLMIFKIVLFPEPLKPTIARVSPASTEKLMFSRITLSSKLLDIFLTSISIF